MNNMMTVRSISRLAIKQPLISHLAIPSASPAIQLSKQPPKQSAKRSFRRSLVLALCVLGTQLSLEAPVVLAQAESPDSMATAAVATDKSALTVNINTASAGELASQLVGIGGSKAEAIVRYREQFGPFESVDELSEVTGIGASTVERNRSVLRAQ